MHARARVGDLWGKRHGGDVGRNGWLKWGGWLISYDGVENNTTKQNIMIILNVCQ